MGCSTPSLGGGLLEATRAVATRLGVELIDFDWVCAGAACPSAHGPEMGPWLAADSLARAKAKGADAVASSCTGCLRGLETAGAALQEHGMPNRAEVAARLEPAAGVPARATHEVLAEALMTSGFEAPARPLKNLKVAAYYGCRSFTDGAGQPRGGRWGRALEETLVWLGAEAVPFGARGECNGGALTLTRSDIVMEKASLIQHEAAQGGADLLAVTCSLCHFNLSARVLDDPLPVVHWVQLVGVGLGLSPSDLGLGPLDPGRRVLAARGIL